MLFYGLLDDNSDFSLSNFFVQKNERWYYQDWSDYVLEVDKMQMKELKVDKCK
jgi:hypothetical protein